MKNSLRDLDEKKKSHITLLVMRDILLSLQRIIPYAIVIAFVKCFPFLLTISFFDLVFNHLNKQSVY